MDIWRLTDLLTDCSTAVFDGYLMTGGVTASCDGIFNFYDECRGVIKNYDENHVKLVVYLSIINAFGLNTLVLICMWAAITYGRIQHVW